MKKTNKKPVLSTEDHSLLVSYLKTFPTKPGFDNENAIALLGELKRARLVKSTDIPADVVRINSKAKIKEDLGKKIIDLILVTPDQANIKEKKISVMAPIGTALLGFSQGQKVKWQVPAGRKTFTILEVINN